MRNPRGSFAKAVRKLNGQNAEIMIDSVDRLIEQLSAHGFQITGKPSDGIGPFWHELWFERPHHERTFAFIEVGFADNGDLSFGVSVGIREYADPHNWHCDGNLSKRRAGLWRSCDLGAVWLLPFKEAMFARDWRFLLANIDAMVRFLETGKPNKNLSDVFVSEGFRPWHSA